jgi:putative tryptophan/tyrosine transport system substrate-binding protein
MRIDCFDINLKSAILLCATLFALCFSADAQQPKKIPRIGYLSASGDAKNPGPLVQAFRQGLRDLGYIETKNILVEYRYLEGKSEATPRLVGELVQLKVDVLVLGPQPAIRAAKQATKSIPIVMVTSQDPVAAGFVSSLARPGGNITGLTRLTRELSGKRLELLKEAVPGVSRVGALSSPTQALSDLKFYEAPASALKIQLQLLELRPPNPDIDAVFVAAARERFSAVITVSGTLVDRYAKRIMDLAIKNRLPSMHEKSDYVDAGGLMSYAADDDEQYRRVAYYVDRILKGAKPADLPVEQPTKFEFVVNLKTAKQIGLTIPPNVLARADRVIR